MSLQRLQLNEIARDLAVDQLFDQFGIDASALPRMFTVEPTDDPCVFKVAFALSLTVHLDPSDIDDDQQLAATNGVWSEPADWQPGDGADYSGTF